MGKKALTSTVSSKGQTTLPAAVRRLLRVGSGDSLLYEVEKEAVRIRKATPLDAAWARAVESTLTEWSGPDDDDL
jgi:AbrB family looped-hinge helix DNA binding protein